MALLSKGKRCTGNLKQRQACRDAKREKRRAGKTSRCRRGKYTRGGYGAASCPADDSIT